MLFCDCQTWIQVTFKEKGGLHIYKLLVKYLEDGWFLGPSTHPLCLLSDDYSI